MVESVLYYGDNLETLRRYIEDESIDLVYLAKTPPRTRLSRAIAARISSYTAGTHNYILVVSRPVLGRIGK